MVVHPEGGFTAALNSSLRECERPAVIFDMDGTLVDVARLREKHLRGRTLHRRDFSAFHAESLSAPAIAWVRDAAVAAHSKGVAVIVVTGRAARWRNVSAWWLALNRVPSEALLMRDDRDGRSDALVKAEMLERISRTWQPIWAFDDNPATIGVWVHAGIPVTTVPGWID